ncbi:hypothetical protein HK104_004164 [Borealophlyctis nickersoniae]|nr:hypothetical protein HK104_004164 [Borealophlyctis nickersoniae]
MTTDGSHPAPSPAKPAMYKYRTKKAYLEAVKRFESDMELVYGALAPSVVFSLTNLVKFNDRKGWVVYLASAQLLAIPVWCVLICLSYRAIIRNKGGDETIMNIMGAVMILCLNMQGALAYNDKAGMASFSEFLEALVGYIGCIGAIFVECGLCCEALAWVHNEYWRGYWWEMQADVLRELRQ